MTPKSQEEILYDELKELYPTLSHEELIEAGHNLDAYLESALVMFERIRHDSEALKQFLVLTDHVAAEYNESEELPTDKHHTSSLNIHLP